MLRLPLRSLPSTEVMAEARSMLRTGWQADYARLSGQLLAELPSVADRPTVLAVTGAQGTGKSTLAAHLRSVVAALGGAAAVLSLDDLYLSRAERAALAAAVHPLLRTRGVPGTHDLGLGMRLLAALTGRAGSIGVPAGRLDRDDSIAIPRFDKGLDERLPVSQWRSQRLPVSLVIVEGWCLALPPQSTAALQQPINQLEQDEDGDGRWRYWVNARLTHDYQAFFGSFDAVVALLPPDFEAVHRWRGEQELGLPAERRMGAAALAHFVAHYERLTRHGLASWPQRADWCVWLAPDHHIDWITHRRAAPGAVSNPPGQQRE